MNLTELSKTIRFDNASKGFDPTEGGIDRYLLLTISEICEAQNELRDGRRIDEIYYEKGELQFKDRQSAVNHSFDGTIKGFKPCGFPVEIADAIIRLLDICGKFDIPVEISDFTSYIWYGPIDWYLLLACKIVTDAHNSVFGGFRRHIFDHSLQAAITLLWHLSLHHKIDIEKVIQEKLEFNRNRPPKHGRKF